MAAFGNFRELPDVSRPCLRSQSMLCRAQARHQVSGYTALGELDSPS